MSQEQYFRRDNYEEMKKSHAAEEAAFINEAHKYALDENTERAGWDWVENSNSKEKISVDSVWIQDRTSYFGHYKFIKETDGRYSVRLVSNPNYLSGDLDEAVRIIDIENKDKTEEEVKEILKKLRALGLDKFSVGFKAD